MTLREVAINDVRSLAWVFTWHKSKLTLYGPADAVAKANKAIAARGEEPNCDRILMFDANDGTQLDSVQICG